MAADLETRIRELESKVAELGDREALRDLRYRYHEYVNEGKFASIPDLFTADGELEFGQLGTAKGREQILAFFKRLNDKPESGSGSGSSRGPHFSFVKQYIHNHVVRIDGDRGTGFSYLEAKPIINGEAYLVSARYDDEYVRTGDGWRFKRMSLIPHFFVPHKEGWAQEEKVKLGGRR